MVKKSEVKDEQFPSEFGAEEVEIAKRSQDVHVEATDTHLKVFVLLKRQYSNDADVHEANILATRQYLINQGLRPVEHGSFVGAEDNEDGESVNLTYAVKVEAAHVATDPEVKHAPVIDSESK